MTLPVTSLYALPLVAIYVMLFVSVVQRRGALRASLGHADDATLHERIRRHANFAENVPLALILMALAEAGGAGSVALHTAGGLLVVGRLVHPLGIATDNPTNPFRIAGASLTLVVIIGLGVMVAMTRF